MFKIEITKNFLEEWTNIQDQKLRKRIYDEYIHDDSNKSNIYPSDHILQGYNKYRLYTSYLKKTSKNLGPKRVLYFKKDNKIILWKIIDHDYEKLSIDQVKYAYENLTQLTMVGEGNSKQVSNIDFGSIDVGNFIYTGRRKIGLRKGSTLRKFILNRAARKNNTITIVSPYLGTLLDSDVSIKNAINKSIDNDTVINLVTRPPKILPEIPMRNKLIENLFNYKKQKVIRRKLKVQFKTDNPENLLKCACQGAKSEKLIDKKNRVMRLCDICKRKNKKNNKINLMPDEKEIDTFFEVLSRLLPNRDQGRIVREYENKLGFNIYFNSSLHAKLYYFEANPSHEFATGKERIESEVCYVGSGNFSEEGVKNKIELGYKIPSSKINDATNFIKLLIKNSKSYNEYFGRNEKQILQEIAKNDFNDLKARGHVFTGKYLFNIIKKSVTRYSRLRAELREIKSDDFREKVNNRAKYAINYIANSNSIESSSVLNK